MTKKNTLHPSVQQFKQFVRKHPLLIKEVREGSKSWQDLYEEWTILGEEDEVWEKYQKSNVQAEDSDANPSGDKKDNEKQGSQGGDILALLKNINLNDVQGHIQNLSGMMSSLQGLLQSFQSKPTNNSSTGEQQSTQNQQGQNGPFNFRQF